MSEEKKSSCCCDNGQEKACCGNDHEAPCCDETPCADEQCACHPPLPKATCTTFVLSMASSALVQLGEVPEPETGTMQEELEHAKYTIDVLSMLHDKVTNGIDEEELRLIDGLLYELRMKYVAKKP